MKNAFPLVISLWACVVTLLQAQTNLIVTTSAPALLNACGEPGLFEVVLYNGGDKTATGITITYELPTGMAYLPGSVKGASESNISNPQRPVFSLPELPACEETVIALRAQKDCGKGLDLRNKAIVKAGNNWVDTVLTEPYNILTPDLNFLLTGETEDTLNGWLLRTVTIINTGLTGVESFWLLDRHTAGVYHILSHTGGALLGEITGQEFDSTFLKFSAAEFQTVGDGDGVFEYGEELTVQMTVDINSCDAAVSRWSLWWSCGSDTCAQDTYTMSVAGSSSKADVRIGYTVYERPGLCKDGLVELRLYNSGHPQLLNNAAALDLRLETGWGHWYGWNDMGRDSCLILSGFEVAGSNVQALTPDLSSKGYGLNLSDMTEDPDGPDKGLSDLDGDKQYDDLGPGDTCIIRFKVDFLPSCLDSSCGYFARRILKGEVWYRDECGQKDSSFTGNSYLLEISTQQYSSHLSPAYQAGDLIHFRINFEPAMTGFSDTCTEHSTVVKILLPSIAALAPSAVPTANGIPLAYFLAGDTLVLEANFLPDTIHVPLLAVCDTAGSPYSGATRLDLFRFWASYHCESGGCAESIPLYCGSSLLFQVYCPDTITFPGGGGGGVPPPPRVIFGSPGLKVSPQANALPFDTLRFSAQAWVMQFYPGYQLDFVFKYNKNYTTGPVLNYLGSRLNFYDKETKLWYPCGEVPRDLDTLYNIRFHIDRMFDPGKCLAGLTLSAGDSIRFELDVQAGAKIPGYYLEPVKGLGMEIVISKQSAGYYAPQDWRALELNLYGGHIQPYVDVDQGSCDLLSCDTTVVRLGYRQPYYPLPLFDPFPGAYRPLARLDRFEVILPDVLQWIPGSEKIVFDTGYANSTLQTQIVSLPNILSPDNLNTGPGYYRLVAVNNGSWPLPDFAFGRRYWLEFSTVHHCYAESQFPFRASLDLTNFLYTNNPAFQADSLWTIVESIDIGQLDWNATPASIVATDSNIVEWDISFQHPYAYQDGAYAIPYPWLAIEPQGNAEILSFTENPESPQPQELALLFYGSNGAAWIRLDSIKPQSNRVFRLRVRLPDCQPGSIRLRHGFNCTGYPADPDAGYPSGDAQCERWVREKQLQYFPKKPGFLLQFVQQPDSLLPLCQPFFYELLVKNYKSGAADSLRVKAWLPEGVSLLAAEIQYPPGSAFQPLPAADTLGGVFRWEIPPTILAQLPGWEKTPLQEFRLRFQLSAGCGFISGQSPAFSVSGTDICGERHNAPLFYAPPLHVQDSGATETNDYDISFSVQPNKNCVAGAIGRIRLDNKGGSLSGMSLPGEKIRLFLKDNFDYLPGSCVPVHNFSPVTEPVKRHQGDWIILEWNLPANIPTGDFIAFNIGILAQCASGCDKMDAILQTTAPAVFSCGDDQCFIDKITKEIPFLALDIFPRFQFKSVSSFSQPLGNGMEKIHLEYVLQNISPLTAPGIITVSFCADENNNGLYDPGIDVLIGMDLLDGELIPSFTEFSKEISLIVPDSLACRLLVVLSASENDCTCYSTEIAVPAPLFNSVLPDTSSCKGQAITLGHAALSHYTHAWSPPHYLDSAGIYNPVYQFSGNGSGIITDTLTVRIERTGGCLALKDTIVIANSLLEAEALVEAKISCYGIADGVISVQLNGVFSPAFYSWSNGEVQQQLSALKAGSYDVTVTDGYGCTTSTSVVLQEPPPLLASLIVAPSPCPGGQGGSLATQASGGTPPYEYQWNSGQVTPQIFSMPGGNYMLTLTDINGCDTVLAAFLYEPSAIFVSIEQVDVKCFDEASGSALATVSGGTPPYLVAWSNGVGGATATGLTAGIYFLAGSDANGCLFADTVSIRQPDELLNMLSVKNVSCGHQADGSIVSQTSGGTPPYFYSWSNGAQTDALYDLFPGKYSLTVADVNGCSSKNEATIYAPLLPLNVEACCDTALQLGQSVHLQAVPDSPVLSYEWQPADYLDCAFCPSPVSTPAENIVYRLRVADSAGCAALREVTIRVDKVRRVYIPNVFSPDEDGNNDIFMIFTDGAVVIVRSISIFDRWGNMVFRKEHIQPNDPAHGWDGTYTGKPLNPGVFAYIAVIEFLDGRTETITGDVTLIR